MNDIKRYTLQDARQYIKSWLKARSYEILPTGNLKNHEGKIEYSAIRIDTLWLDYKAQVASYRLDQNELPPQKRQKLIALSQADLKAALNEAIYDLSEAAKEKFALGFKHDEKASPLIADEIIKTISIAEPGSALFNIEVNLLKHWIWLVKRNMFEKRVIHHIMPIFYGKQGTGKSEFIRALIRPLAELSMNSALHVITDERMHMSLSKHYIAFLDELQGIARTDIDTLKNLISNDYVSVRKFFTQDTIRMKQNCSFIGATNKPINEQIIDSTGMRRFYQYTCKDIIDWNKVNKLDYKELWLSVDENNNNGYISNILNDISSIQEDYIYQDDISNFIEECEIKGASDEGAFITTLEMYNIYKDWCEESGHKPLNRVWLGRKLKNRGFNTHKLENKRGYFATIKGKTKIKGVLL